MTRLPRVSGGVVLAGSDDIWVAHDAVRGVAHQLNASAAALLAACEDRRDLDAVIAGWADASGTPRGRIAEDVRRGLADLTARGLLGRTETPAEPEPLVGSTAERTGWFTGQTHAVIDRGVAFRCPDPKLVERIDAYLGTGVEGRRAQIHLDVVTNGDYGALLIGDDEWGVPDFDLLLQRLQLVLNPYAAQSRSCCSLHAGAAQSPAGATVLLPGSEDSGKSTLTAALVTAGWHYLGDEVIGVRPGTATTVAYPKRLTLSAASRSALGLAVSDDPTIAVEAVRPDAVRVFGDAGPIDAVVFAAYRPGEPAGIERLDARRGLDALLANTLNLGALGRRGLQTLCDLAVRRPCYHLVRDDARAAVEIIGAALGA